MPRSAWLAASDDETETIFHALRAFATPSVTRPPPAGGAGHRQRDRKDAPCHEPSLRAHMSSPPKEFGVAGRGAGDQGIQPRASGRVNDRKAASDNK